MTTRRPLFPRALAILALALLPLWSACADSPSDPLAGPDVKTVVLPQQAVGYETALAAKNRHTAALLSRAGLLGTGVGVDDDGGHVLTVYAVRPGVANLPATLDGVPVVAVSTGLIMADDVNDPTSKERPAPNGFSIGHPDITAGTLGAIVKNSVGDLFILSNNHVLAASNGAQIGDPSYQPGPFDGGTSADQIGTLADFVPIDFNGGNNTVDAAITSVSGADVTAMTPSYAYGAPGTSTVSASVGQNVQKFGRTTGHTTGQVAETNVTVDVCYAARGPFCTRIARFVNQFTISPGSFSGGGDSGSLIVTNDAGKNPVGLLFAGSDTRTIANRIGDALGAFGVTITTDSDDGGGGDPGDGGDGDPGDGGLTLSATGYKVRGLQKADLSWSNATGTNVDIYRNGSLLTTTANDGFFTDDIDQRGGGTYQYEVCEAGTTTCSNTATVTF